MINPYQFKIRQSLLFRIFFRSKYWKLSCDLHSKKIIKNNILSARKLCSEKGRVGITWNAYGGYYFSPKQALIFDYLIKHFPKNKSDRAYRR